jgi:predicted phosphodiesterase
MSKSKVLVIGDIHAPYNRPSYLPFCKEIYNKYRCNKVVFIGDVVDLHSISFHPKHPELPNAAMEYDMAKKEIAKWKKAFPKALVCIGNHDSRPVRMAETVSIPEILLKDFSSIWDTPDWSWNWEFIIDDVCYTHGTGCGGIYPAFNKMRSTGTSYVMGHTHANAGIKWEASTRHRLFGMDVGCGCNDRSMAFAYGQFARRRSIIGCGVVIEGIPYYEICPIGKDEKFYDKTKSSI